MINAEFLASCSDEQIERGVAWLKAKKTKNGLLLGNHYKIWSNGLGRIYGQYGRFRPCLSPNDIIPIQFANGIGLIFDDESIKPNWIAIAEKITGRHHEYYDIEVQNANPLRAICHVYILMSVAK
jgi:hypothetical protein